MTHRHPCLERARQRTLSALLAATLVFSAGTVRAQSDLSEASGLSVLPVALVVAAPAMLLSGGGISTGQVIGATNAKGEHPVERPLSPNDLWATVYRFLGINYEESFLDHQGRPMPILPFGEPIRELFG